MMELQKVFKKSYMENLRRNIQISDYQGETFPFDPSKVKALANVYKPEGLLDRLDPDDDLTTAVELYKAYDTVTPLLASLPDLWVGVFGACGFVSICSATTFGCTERRCNRKVYR